MPTTKKVRECMKQPVISISHTASIGDAAQLFSQRQVGTLPVIDADGRLVGMLQMIDLLRLVIPDFLDLVQDFDFLGNYGAIEWRIPSPEVQARPITELMQAPVSAEETWGLLHALSVLIHQNLQDLPVVDADGLLIGIASRVDIGSRLLSAWNPPSKDAP